MPTIPTTTVMSTLMTGAAIHDPIGLGHRLHCHDRDAHTKASSMAIRTPSENSMPHTALMTLGDMQAILATHSGKLTQ